MELERLTSNVAGDKSPEEILVKLGNLVNLEKRALTSLTSLNSLIEVEQRLH